jgi:glyoxylase-like metal-dependent hydrolase (beta-lactamase superfamily II)
MNNEFYNFKIGEFECITVSDGGMNYPVELFFSNAPTEDVNAALRQRNLTTEHIHTPYTCLFINTGQNRVMIDTGAGDIAKDANEIFPNINNSNSRAGKLPDNLAAAGIKPAQVDTVIITHAHPDHIAGTLTHDGELVFKHAQYFIDRTEHEFWISAEAEAKASPSMLEIARRFLAPLEGRLTLVEGQAEILPGISVLPAPGHTPGHTVVKVSSNGAELLHIADTVLYPLHLEHPDWLPVFDVDPEGAAMSKAGIFDRAVERKALVFAHHFPPFPALGYVEKREMGWEWQPIEMS